MKRQTLGTMIAALRKERGMTQAELADVMCVTDKAVSKWERDLSCPDFNTVPKLAEVLGVSVEELMQGKRVKAGDASSEGESAPDRANIERIIDLALKGVGAAMGVAVAVLSFLNAIDTTSALGMLGIGVACLGLAALSKAGE